MATLSLKKPILTRAEVERLITWLEKSIRADKKDAARRTSTPKKTS